MNVQFVNNYGLAIVGYIGNYPNVTEPASTGTIQPGGVGNVNVPGGSWTATIQIASDPPLGPKSPQENVFGRTSGVSGNVVIMLDKFGRLSITQE